MKEKIRVYGLRLKYCEQYKTKIFPSERKRFLWIYRCCQLTFGEIYFMFYEIAKKEDIPYKKWSWSVNELLGNGLFYWNISVNWFLNCVGWKKDLINFFKIHKITYVYLEFFLIILQHSINSISSLLKLIFYPIFQNFN
jgi:hypothetical protein